ERGHAVAFCSSHSHGAELTRSEGDGVAALARLLVFADAEHGREAGIDGHAQFSCDERVVFTVNRAPLGMADDDETRAAIAQHVRGNLAGERTRFLIRTVLRAGVG